MRHRHRIVCGFALLCLLPGCGTLPLPTPPATSGEPTQQTSQASPTSQSPTPASDPTPRTESTTIQPPSDEPKVEVLDASRWSSIDFASPSGRIVCTMSGDPEFEGATCGLPTSLMMGESGWVPAAEEICPEDAESISVTQVWVGPERAEWQCAGGIAAWPAPDSDRVEWARSGFGTVIRSEETGDQRFMSLPYGKALKNGEYVCESRETGVTCKNGSGVGFRVNKAGVKFYR